MNSSPTGFAFYMPSHPLTLHVLDTLPTLADEKRIVRDGVVLLCPARDAQCVNTATLRAIKNPPDKWIEVDIDRRYMGVQGKPARYLIITIPPQQ